MRETLHQVRRALTEHTELPPVLEPVARPLRWLWVLYRSLVRDRAFEQAAAMSYTTLVALVPMLLLLFAVLDAIGLLDESRGAVERLVFQSFLGDIEEVRSYLLPALVAADLRALGLIGVVMLSFVAWRLYVLVEEAYSGIFGVAVARPLRTRLLLFYAGMTLMPVVFVAAFLYAVRAAAGFGADRLVFVLMEGAVLLAALRFFPNTRVRWGPALAGTFVSLALLQVTHAGFRLYVQLFGGDAVQVVYGSLAALPVFLVWLWLLWVVVLLGVEVAAVAQNFPTMIDAEREAAFEEAFGRRSPGVDAALHVATLVAARFARGDGPMPTAEVAAEAGIAAKSVLPVLEALAAAGLLARQADRWLLARPAERVRLREVADAWREHAVFVHEDREALRRIREDLDRGLPGTLAEGVERWLAPPRPPPPDVRSGT